jgi:HAD superfamily hydrolase (TIGR01549 family)
MKYVLHKKLHEYRAVLLDMDGTLYYQLPVRICMAFALAAYYTIHLKKLTDLFALAAFRKSYDKGFLAKGNAVIDYWMQEKPLKYIRMFRDKKLLELVQRLKNNGAVIAVYSDYPVTKKIDALRPFTADFAFCASDPAVQCLKPDTKGLKHIVETLGKPVEDTVFIGDRYEKDGRCAEGVGMDYIILDTWPLLRNILLYKRELSNAE